MGLASRRNIGEEKLRPERLTEKGGEFTLVARHEKITHIVYPSSIPVTRLLRHGHSAQRSAAR